tara:strand:+ start:319 stop:852 length:534 start_codon:yes stop_codon:yes gene_type:complete
MTAFDQAWNLVKMGMDLTSDTGEYFRWNIWGWQDILTLMQSYGWKPLGTHPIDWENVNEEEGELVENNINWNVREMDYHSNGGQVVGDDDIEGMILALDRAIGDIEKIIVYPEPDKQEGGTIGDLLGAWVSNLQGGIEGANTEDVESELNKWANPEAFKYLKEWRDYLEYSSLFQIG